MLSLEGRAGLAATVGRERLGANRMEPWGHLTDLMHRPQEVNYAIGNYLDHFGSDSADLGIVGDQRRLAQHQWLGDQGVVVDHSDFRAAVRADRVGDVRAKA